MTERRGSATRAAVRAGVAAMIVLGAAACGSTAPGTPSTSSAASSSTSSASSARDSSSGASTSAASSGTSGPDFTAPTIPPGEVPTSVPIVPGSSQAGSKATTVTGTVEAGVESGCVVLTGAGGAVLANLIGLDLAATPIGTEVVVTGTFQQDLMTTCQQGTPFEVTSVEKR